MIRFRTNQPDFSDVELFEYHESERIHRPVSEGLLHDAPKLLGHHMMLSHYVDANLMHCLLTGRSVTGILHFINQTPINWFLRKQVTFKTETYGFEFVTARTYVEQPIDLRNTFTQSWSSDSREKLHVWRQ